jgi:hypothetical protein
MRGKAELTRRVFTTEAALDAISTHLQRAEASPFNSNLTPELTGRAYNAITDKLTMKGTLTRAPVE